MNNRGRILAVALVASASALVSIAQHEDYRGAAYMPTPNDRPTIGFGATTDMSGHPVQIGEQTNPVRALIKLNADVTATQDALHQCIGDVPLYQHEWDAYISLAYNIGPGSFCRSTLVRFLHHSPPDYPDACRQILRWDRQAGHVLPGLVTRRRAEYRLCMGNTL